MAKGARSSTVKRNNTNLRAKIFGPAADERTARLSAKLQEIASKPRPTQDESMDLDNRKAVTEEQSSTVTKTPGDMDLEMKGASTNRKPSSKRQSSGIEKRLTRKKPRNQIIFPTSAAKKKRIAQSKKKSV